MLAAPHQSPEKFRVLSMTRVSWYILSWTPGTRHWCETSSGIWCFCSTNQLFLRINIFKDGCSERIQGLSFLCFLNISLALQIEDYLLNSQEFTHMIMLDADAALVRHHVDILGGIAQHMFLGDVVGMDSPELAAVRPGVVSGCKISGRNHT